MSELVDLVRYWEKFKQLEPNGELSRFGEWLSVNNRNLEQPTTQPSSGSGNDAKPIGFDGDRSISLSGKIDSDLIGQRKSASKKTFKADDPSFNQLQEGDVFSKRASYLIGKMNQYLLVYTKPIMKKYELHSMDDFGYLAVVQWHGSISKSKACAAMLQELTTGIDIIKRLVKLAYLKEVVDKTDKRQKLLQLTARGKKVMDSLQLDFARLPDLLGDLKQEHRKVLVEWLMSLDDFHAKILKEMKQGTDK